MLDFNTLVVLPIQNTFSRPIVITPYASRPGSASYSARGVYITQPLDVASQDGVLFSDQRTFLDIRASEYTILPKEMDWVMIPAHMSMPAIGPFQIQDIDEFADGKIRLTLRKAEYDEPRLTS